MKNFKALANYLSTMKYFLVTILFTCLFIKDIESQCNYTIQINQTSNDCNNQNVAQLQAIISGPGVFEDFTWLNSNLDTISNTTTALDLFDGVYVFITEDSISNCITYATAIIQDSSNNFTVLENPVSCHNCEDGSVEIAFINTSNQAVFQWDDVYNQTTKIASDIEEGVYSTLIQNQNCTLTAIASVNDCGENIKASFSFTSPTCPTCVDGTILASVSGGTPGYSYQWDDDFNQTTLLASSMKKDRAYTFTVTDTLNCQKTFFIDSFEICKNNFFTFINTNPPSCSGCSDGIAFINYNGIYSPVSHLWTYNGSSVFTQGNLAEGNYEVILTDNIGCKIREIVSIDFCTDKAIPSLDSIFITNEYNYFNNSAINQNDIVNNNNGASYILSKNTNYGITNILKDGSISYTPHSAYTGIDKFSYSIFTDCGFSDTVTAFIEVNNADMVWPGDVNNDGFVDNFDLLPIGAFYNTPGPQRQNTSTNYQGFLANDFNFSQISGVNIKHADCDGSGIINLADLNVINLNYGLKHSKVIEEFYGETPLIIEAPAIISAGDTVEFKIKLGSSNFPANNVYGLAYTFNIDPNIIDKNYFEVKFNDSWFTPNNNRLSMHKAFLNKGKIDIAQSRYISGNNANGEGDIGTIIVVIEEDLGGEAHRVELNRVRLIDNNENEILTNRSVEEFIISSIDEKNKKLPYSFNISPNPAEDILQIEFNDVDDYNIEIYSVLGEKIYETSIENQNNLRLENKFDNGIYFLTITQNNESSTQKIVFKK